jgi:peroxiredoxin
MGRKFSAALIGLLFATTITLAGKDSSQVKLDEKVPNFTLKDYTGKEYSLYDYLGSKGIVVMFIATQCPVSNAYNARMVDLHDLYAPKGIVFLAINSNKQESIEEIAEHSAKHGFQFPVLKDWKNVIADKFDAQVTPETYLIDSTGVLRYHGRIDDERVLSKVTQHDLRDALDAYLEGKPILRRDTKAFGCTIKRVN